MKHFAVWGYILALSLEILTPFFTPNKGPLQCFFVFENSTANNDKIQIQFQDFRLMHFFNSMGV